MTDDPTLALEKRVLDAIENLRNEIKVYRKAAGALPACLRDGQAELLREDALQNVTAFRNRYAMMEALAAGKTGAEVGVQYGAFSRFLLDTLPVEKLYLLDMNEKNIRADVTGDPRTEVMIGDSSSNISRLPDGSLDWAYIDGDHTAKGVRRDLVAARSKVKEGGMIFFNDYTPWSIGEVLPYGVMPVVNSFINEGYPVSGFALSPHGYFDIAVRNTRFT